MHDPQRAMAQRRFLSGEIQAATLAAVSSMRTTIGCIITYLPWASGTSHPSAAAG